MQTFLPYPNFARSAACLDRARLSTLQTIGRGLRTYPGKDHAVIVDIMDPYRYLAEHFVQRLNIYKQMGWI